MTPFTPNEGDRPSRFLIARALAGELEDVERQAVEASLEAARWRTEVEQLQVPPFDPVALRARANAIEEDEAVTLPSPANRSGSWRWMVLPAAMAAAALVALRPAVEPPSIRARGAAGLDASIIEDGRALPWDGRPVPEGIVLAFRAHLDRAALAALVSIDGTGHTSLYTDTPTEPVGPGAYDLPVTVVLDAAPGPEVFVLGLDWEALDLAAEAGRLRAEGGVAALEAWDQADDDISILVIPRP